MRVLAIANAKGGVGKTTTALSLGAALAEEAPSGDGPVLLVDLDPGGGLTGSLHVEVAAVESSAFRLFFPPFPESLEGLARETPIPRVHLVPSHPAMVTLDARLSVAVDRERLLRRALEAVGVYGASANGCSYSWVVLDCGPYMGILSVNALSAAEAVILPLPPEYVVLLGGKMLLGFVEEIKQHFNPGLRILGILPTMVDIRTRHAQEMLEQLRSVFHDLVFGEAIPYTVRLKEAPITGTSIFAYDSGSRAAEAYRRLAEEVRARCRLSA